MARVLLAWELGGGFGHLAPLRALARELRGRGHDCVFAVRELEAAEDFLEPGLGAVVQAPLRLSPIRNPLRVQVSYASLLHNTGFDDAIALAARLRAWHEIVQRYACDLLLTDHAPSAIAAAHGIGLPALQQGSGFTVPPSTHPYPLFQPDPRANPALLAHNEAEVSGVLAAAYARLGIDAPNSLQQVLDHAQPALLTYAELDHYGARLHGSYLGLPDQAKGATPSWPPGDGPRLFAYLRPSRQLPALLTALQRLPARVLLRIGGATAASLREFERPGFCIVDEAVNLQLAARDCDGFINYAAHGTAAEMLLAGKPGLLLPETIEQSLMAMRVQQLGAAIIVPVRGDFNLSAALRQLIDDTAMQRAAQAFAQRHAGQDRAAIVPALVDQALALIRNPQRASPAGS